MMLLRSLRRKAVLAFLAALAVVGVIAAPASAAIETGTLEDPSSLTLASTVYDLGNPPDDPPVCAGTWSRPEIDVDFDNPSAGDTLVDAIRIPEFDVETSGGTFLGVASLHTGSQVGEISGTDYEQDISVLIQVFNCDGMGAPQCTIPVNATVNGTYINDIAELSGNTTVTPNFGCNSLIQAVVSGQATLDVTVDFT